MPARTMPSRTIFCCDSFMMCLYVQEDKFHHGKSADDTLGRRTWPPQGP